VRNLLPSKRRSRLIRSTSATDLGQLLSQHKDVAAARGALGASLVAQRRYAEAEPLLVESFAAGGGHSAGQAAARLVRLYEAWGRPEKADAYRGVAARR